MKRRHEMERVYRSILLDTLSFPDAQRLWWAVLTDPAVMPEGVVRDEADGGIAAVEALWLDTWLEQESVDDD